MKKLSQRGVARVSAVWMIVLIVLFFVSLAFVYVANQEAQRAKDSAATASSSATAANAARDVAVARAREISLGVGFYERDTPGATTDMNTLADGLTSLRGVFPDMPETTVTDFERAIQPVIDAYRAKLDEIRTLDGRISSLESQLSASKSANTDISSQLQAQIDKLEQDLRDANQNASDEKARLEGQVADLRNQVNQTGNDLNTERGTSDDLRAQAERDAAAAQTRITTLNDAVVGKAQREAEGPDGEVLAVSKALGTGWINRGARDRVSRGLRFEVRTGNPNPLLGTSTKGFAEVIDVKETTSEVRFFDLADQYDPIVSRDRIFNPIFDPGGPRYACLIGRFSGSYNEAEITALLEDIGITVQAELDRTTNYLIVGGPLFVDEEGEPVEDPIQPSELGRYKDATALGVRIISINDFRHYFRR
jgi:ABC-type transporter Mla subunit MlaD